MAKHKLPTSAEEARFWSLIEDAWATQSKRANKLRKALATRDLDDDEEPDLEAIEEALEGVLASLRAVYSSNDFPKEELVALTPIRWA
jgi:hypothetical protein